MMALFAAALLAASSLTGSWLHHRGGVSQQGRCVGEIPAQVRPAWQVDTGGPVHSTPVADKEALYIGTADGDVLALSRDSGATRWSAKLGEPIEAPITLGTDGAYVGDTAGMPAVSPT